MLFFCESCSITWALSVLLRHIFKVQQAVKKTQCLCFVSVSSTSPRYFFLGSSCFSSWWIHISRFLCKESSSCSHPHTSTVKFDIPAVAIKVALLFDFKVIPMFSSVYTWKFYSLLVFFLRSRYEFGAACFAFYFHRESMTTIVADEK